MSNEIHQPFVDRMGAELVRNSRLKGDWSAYFPTPEQALAELRQHVEKLALSVSIPHAPSVREFSADVGNIAMKIFELYG